MARYSLNPDGSLVIEDDTNNGFVTFGKIIKKITKVIAIIIILSSVIVYGIFYYNNAPNEMIYSILTGDNNFSSCFNLNTTKAVLDGEASRLEWSQKDISKRIEYGVEWVTEQISDIRRDASY